MGDINFSVEIPLDEEGMIGRECLKCEQYFKVKPGTGLETEYSYCPYCDYEGDINDFWTKPQLEYAESIVMNKAYKEIIKPNLDKLTKTFKKLERETRNSLIKIKVYNSGKIFDFPIKYYNEEDLETTIKCDNCGLDFAIYGIFSKCPDCNKLNAFLIYDKSIEVIRKKLNIFSKPEIPDDIQEISLSSILTSAISTFDGLGKELRKRRIEHYPEKPRNLFQNLKHLDKIKNHNISKNHSNFNELLKFFQVRHIYEHNMGVIDDDFVQKFPEYQNFLGRKYPLRVNDLHDFLDWMEELGQIMKKDFNK
jgi:thiol-disulfide isomerase/thioredoxin